jgi:hypothetical protein
MNPIQKGIVACALLLLAASTAVAPYEFTAHNEIARLANRESYGVAIQGVTYAPLWAPPATSEDPGSFAPSYANDVVGVGAVIDELHLSAGRLVIEWLGILTVAVAGIAFTARRRPSDEAPPYLLRSVMRKRG